MGMQAHAGSSRLLFLASKTGVTSNLPSHQVGLHLVLKDRCRFTFNLLRTCNVASLVRTLQKTLTRRLDLGKKIEDIKIIASSGLEITDDRVLSSVINQNGTHIKIQDETIPIITEAPVVEPRMSTANSPTNVGQIIIPLFNDFSSNFSLENSKFYWKRINTHIAKTKKPKKDQSSEESIEYSETDLNSNGMAYQIKEEDRDFYLKVYLAPYSSDLKHGPTKNIVYTKKVSSKLKGVTDLFEKFFDNVKNSGQDLITVGSYNVLANHFISTTQAQDWYSYCPKLYRTTTFRPSRLLTDIINLSMDILLCQEYEDFGNISYILQSQYGIGVHFAKFSSKLACADQYGGDGIATLFKTSKFEMLEKFSCTVADVIEAENFNDLNKIYFKYNPEDKLSRTPTLFSITLLQAITNPKQLILVANMHLKGPPFNQTEQLFQAMFVMHQINDKLQQLEKKYESKIELLIGGDLNCVPESLSRNFFAGNFEKALSIFDDDEKQTIASSLKDIKTLDAFEDKHCSTNYTEEFTGSIDHMFYDSTAFVPHIISQVSTDDLMRVSDGQFDKLPNIGFLSDHVPILAAFKRVQKT